MMEGTLAQASAIMQGTLHGNDAAFRGIGTDSRKVAAGELFFALQGPKFDGNDFVPQAAALQAAGAVVNTTLDVNLPTIEVSDTRRALGQLAAAWRKRMPAALIGLTGSNGKTTLKELIANCLSLAAPTLATRGNLNNDIGVPLMLAEIGPQHRYAVIELGANHPGEIAYLTSLATPQVAVITNAGPAHLEGFGDIEGVAHAKGEILQGEPRPEWAVLNADDAFFAYWKSLASDVRVITFGFGAAADVRAVDVKVTDTGSAFRLVMPRGEQSIELPLAGRHNVAHACAAAAVAFVLGAETDTIRQGLAEAKAVTGRLQALSGIAGATVFDDSYNANPASVIAAAEFLASRPGAGWLVLGDMRELGNESGALHRAVGEAAKRAGVLRLFAAGTQSREAVAAFGTEGCWFDSVEALIAALVRELERHDGSNDAQTINVLVKGSRAMRMERVVQALTHERRE